MPGKNQHPARELLAVSPIDVLRRLPAMGKLMIAANNGGVTHERIGPVEAIATSGDWGIVAGTTHDCRIAESRWARVPIHKQAPVR